jgi:hypothetical protein
MDVALWQRWLSGIRSIETEKVPTSRKYTTTGRFAWSRKLSRVSVQSRDNTNRTWFFSKLTFWLKRSEWSFSEKLSANSDTQWNNILLCGNYDWCRCSLCGKHSLRYFFSRRTGSTPVANHTKHQSFAQWTSIYVD